MQVLVSLVVGLIIWIVGWAFGIKPFDAFLVTILLVLGGVVARLATPFIKEFIRP
ncbi:MAG: hypothetical protein NVSMB25_01670 [Thermoleophilaceae bacterium]